MHDVHQALKSIEQSAGLKKLEFNSAGVAELKFDGEVSIYLVKISDTQLEFVNYLEISGYEADIYVLRALLHANHMGDATGCGRLALDPQDDELMFCERVNVTELDAKAFEARLLEFVKHVTFWLSDDARSKLGPRPQQPATINADMAFQIRV